MLAGAGGLDGGVESEEIGLVSDFLDDGDFLGDGFHGLDGFADGFTGFLDIESAFEGHLFHLTGVLRVLGDGSVHLFEAGGGLLNGGGLFAGALGEQLSGGGDLRGGRGYRIGDLMHLPDQPAQCLHELIEPSRYVAYLIVRWRGEPFAQIALTARDFA